MGDIHLREIDATNRGDHFRLIESDKCYFLYEYTAHQGYAFSDTNQLISNLKKKPSNKNRADYKYKGQAISKAAAALRQVLNDKWLATGTLVPVPSSKARDHPDYDDRNTQICRLLKFPAPDVRELVVNTTSHEAAHESALRPTVEELLACYQINENLAASAPVESIGIFDDVLTAGTHFKAMQRLLSDRFPDARVFGIFLARRALPKADSDFDDDDF